MVGPRIKVGWPARRDRACWEPPEHRRGEPEESTEHAGNRLKRETVTRTSGKTTARARTVVGSRGCRPGKVQGQSAESGSGGNHVCPYGDMRVSVRRHACASLHPIATTSNRSRLVPRVCVRACAVHNISLRTLFLFFGSLSVIDVAAIGRQGLA